MIIWNEKELRHIKEHLKVVLEVNEEVEMFGKDRKLDVEMLLKNFEDVNTIEFTNELLFDVLDDYYSTYWVKGYTSEDFECIDWLTKTDGTIYNKMYDFED